MAFGRKRRVRRRNPHRRMVRRARRYARRIRPRFSRYDSVYKARCQINKTVQNTVAFPTLADLFVDWGTLTNLGTSVDPSGSIIAVGDSSEFLRLQSIFTQWRINGFKVKAKFP